MLEKQSSVEQWLDVSPCSEPGTVSTAFARTVRREVKNIYSRRGPFSYAATTPIADSG
ncbi:ORF048 [Saltwater crocodilepox virus]|nr:ORF048 [Saltwater crocodilepox virus]